MPNVEWLLHEAATARPVEVGERTVMENDFWRATIERLEIGPGLRVFLTDAEVKQELVVQPRDNETEPWMASNIAVCGHAEIELPDGRQTGVGPGRAVMYRPSARNPRYRVPGLQRHKMVGYGLRGDRIERLFDGDVPASIRPLIEREITASRVVEVGASKRLRTLAEGMFAPDLNGPLRILFMEGTVLQLLAAMAAAAAGQEAAPAPIHGPLGPRERHAVMEARGQLLADMRNPPSLGDLAAAVGMTEKRLNQGFRAEFGATVFDVLRNERLEHARLALEEGASLKTVAFRVGYNHVTNFINAFSQRYGAPPRRYVEGQTDQSE